LLTSPFWSSSIEITPTDRLLLEPQTFQIFRTIQ